MTNSNRDREMSYFLEVITKSGDTSFLAPTLGFILLVKENGKYKTRLNFEPHTGAGSTVATLLVREAKRAWKRRLTKKNRTLLPVDNILVEIIERAVEIYNELMAAKMWSNLEELNATLNARLYDHDVDGLLDYLRKHAVKKIGYILILVEKMPYQGSTWMKNEVLDHLFPEGKFGKPYRSYVYSETKIEVIEVGKQDFTDWRYVSMAASTNFMSLWGHQPDLNKFKWQHFGGRIGKGAIAFWYV